MELEKKPKCRGCGKAGEDVFYWYLPKERGKGGYLWHYDCAKGINDTIHKKGNV